MTQPPDGAIDVVVEIPRGSRNKYEMDKDKGVIRLDRRLFSATVYPADYGYVPDTLAEDGDPLDALVLLDDPTFPGCWVTARPVAILWMEDDKGPDAKVICYVRHVGWIMDSIERLVRRNRFRVSRMFNFDSGGTVYNRISGLAEPSGLVGFSLNAVKEAYYGEQSDRAR